MLGGCMGFVWFGDWVFVGVVIQTLSIGVPRV